ncbi:MAG: CoA-binding protein [Deltaproteobacteria bacterium]|nr:CoA-binding protein [Deltaproteobacteria bacterium]
MDVRMKASLEAIFSPRSVAVIGASNNPKRWGFETMMTMLAANYRHELYPVNPNEREVMGMRCYPSLAHLPGEIDLAVIVVNAALVPGIIKECIAKKVKGGVIITAGFAEIGSEGAALQERLTTEAKAAGFYFIGPNCMGVWSSAGRVNTIYWPDLVPGRGSVSFISQSDTLGDSREFIPGGV